MGARQEEAKAVGAGGKRRQELLQGQCLSGAFLQPFPPVTSVQKRDTPVPSRRGWLDWHAGGPSSSQDCGESQGCSIPGGASLGGGFPAHHELPPALLYHEGSGQRGQEGTVRAEHSLGRTTLFSNHTLGRLTYLLNPFRHKPNQMQATYLPKH